MKIITFEEHFLDPDIARASGPSSAALSPNFATAYDSALGMPFSASADVLGDLGAGRLADMDANHITTQVLSSMGGQQLPADVAVELTRKANDTLAQTVQQYPDRFKAFTALPTAVPDAAADELARGVTELGFVGTLIFGRTEGDFLDAPRFEPILARAAALGVPIYLHPGLVPAAVRDANYSDLDPLVGTRFATSAWGWHQETAVHFLHLVLSGTLDRYPELQFILGHWGEMIPFYLDRLDESLPPKVTKLDRTIGEYMRQNVFVTPSGMWSQAQLQFCVQTLGADRIIYAVDYPFIGNQGAAAFLEAADLPDTAKENIAHATAERLLGL